MCLPLVSLGSGETCRSDHGTSWNTKHLSQIGWRFSGHARDPSWFGLDNYLIWVSTHQLYLPGTLSIQESAETYYSSQVFQPCLKYFLPILFSRCSPSKSLYLCLLRASGSNLLRSFCFAYLMGRAPCGFAQPQGAWWGSSASRNQATQQFWRHHHIARGDRPKLNRIHEWSFNDFYVGANHHSCTRCSRCLSPGFGTSSNCLTCIHSRFGLSRKNTFGHNQQCSKIRFVKGSPLWIRIYFII